MGFFKDARVTLINPNIEQLYSSMIPGLISKKYNFEESSIDLVKLTIHDLDSRAYKITSEDKAVMVSASDTMLTE